MKDRISVNEEVQLADMEDYYKVQAKIYDMTRWIFLFGRDVLMRKLPFDKNAKLRFLDVGCGTGWNTKELVKKFPNAHVTALDVSPDMLRFAQKKLKKYEDRITFLHKPYDKNAGLEEPFDMILFSYALSMINPQFYELIDQAQYDLKEDGYVAVVDFHDTKVPFYKKFMRANHVRLDGQILPLLEEKYTSQLNEVKKGYFGVWEYMKFLGQKKS